MHHARPDDPVVPERWRSLRVESLDGGSWADPPADSTGLVLACHNARRVPLGELSAAEARVLLGQNIATRFVLPRAIELLRSEPMLDAELFEGDLLAVTCCRVVDGALLHPAATEALRDALCSARSALDAAEFEPAELRSLVEGALQVLVGRR